MRQTCSVFPLYYFPFCHLQFCALTSVASTCHFHVCNQRFLFKTYYRGFVALKGVLLICHPIGIVYSFTGYVTYEVCCLWGFPFIRVLSVLTDNIKEEEFFNIHKSIPQCKDDCEKLKTGNFATNCEKNGGLFKCCIRQASFKRLNQAHP